MLPKCIVSLIVCCILNTLGAAFADIPAQSCKGTFKISGTKYQLALKFRESLLGYKLSGTIVGKGSRSNVTYKVRGIYADGIGIQGTATEQLPSTSTKRKRKVLTITGLFLTEEAVWGVTISRSKRDKKPITFACKIPEPVAPTPVPELTATPIPITPFKIKTYEYTGNIPKSLSWAVGTFGNLTIKYESNPPAVFPITASVVQTGSRPTTLTFPKQEVVIGSPSSGTIYDGAVDVPNGIGCDGVLNQTTQGKIFTKMTITDAVGKSSSWTLAWYCCPDFAACPP